MTIRGRVAIAAVSLALVVADIMASATSRHGDFTAATLTLALATGMIYVVSGLIAARRRPESLLGLLLCITGLLLLVTRLDQSNEPLPYTIGLLTFWLMGSVLTQILVTFPTGRIRTWTERVLVAAAYLAGLVIVPSIFLFLDPKSLFCPTCPENLMLIKPDPLIADRITFFDTWFVVAIACAVVWLLAYRWWRGSTARRRILGPALWVGIALTAEFIVVSFHSEWLSPRSSFFWVDQGLTAAYPLAFLIGLLRTRISRSAVGDLVIELGQGSMPSSGLRDALAKRLGDPSLQIAYRVEELDGWVDGSGRPIELPAAGSGRTSTMLELDGEPIAALVHDEALRDDPELVEAVVSAARLAVTNERLQARVRAQLELVRRSRARVVAAADQERRRLERDLHDGAQQRLVGLSLVLAIAQEEVAAGDGAEGMRLLGAARAEAEEALVELRDLARGIHPAILTDAGLGPAVRSLINRSPIPVRVETITERRFAPSIEATAYFAVAEALTNSAKHAHSSIATVSLVARDDRLIVDIADDGAGGADPAGSGLHGLGDRIAAAGGTLEIESPSRGGTHLHLELPCE